MDCISRAAAAVRDRLPAVDYRLDEPMKEHTSFRIGGLARVMYLPKSAGELTALYETLREYEAAVLIIGNGTNMLISDRPLEIAVIKTTGLCSVELSGDNEVTADAGAPLSQLAGFARDSELTGLEFAYGIPGSVGGAVSMNAGAYERDMSGVVYRTAVYSRESGMRAITAGEHSFSYRRSRFTDSDEIVISSTFRLRKGIREHIGAEMETLSARRRESQPLDMPSAGSTFKRPKNGYAAALIEQAGLKGETVGGAQVSDKHSGFIVNRGNATFEDIMRLMERVRDTVYLQTGVELEPEVKIIR